MPSAVPINNRRKPNYLITPSHCVQTELPVVDNKYLISKETERINQGCRLEQLKTCQGTAPLPTPQGVTIYFLGPLRLTTAEWKGEPAACWTPEALFICLEDRLTPTAFCSFAFFLEELCSDLLSHCVWNVPLHQSPDWGSVTGDDCQDWSYWFSIFSMRNHGNPWKATLLP